jgi:NTE family protein
LPPRKVSRLRVAPGLGLVLTGGGARTAYQVGALLAISDWLGRPRRSPFTVITGTSAGAINATALAARAGNFARGLEGLAGVWHNLRVGDVFRCDRRAIYGRAVHWLWALLRGGLGSHNPRALLDCRPLRALLERHVNLSRIDLNLTRGALDAVGLTASGYASGRGVTFYQAAGHLPPWSRERMLSRPVELTLDHVMASVAIPLLFEAVRIDDDWYGDGSMRDHTPLSTAISLGAERLLVLSTRNSDAVPLPQPPPYPTLGKIAGYVLDSLFMDGVGPNLERLQSLNELVQRAGAQPPRRFGRPLRHVDACVLAPSADLRVLAMRHSGRFPRPVRRLLRGLGAFGELSPLPSFLLFDGAFCSDLMDLGYADAEQRRDTIMATLLGSDIRA